MNPRRLLNTPPAALADRARQEVSRAWDRHRGPGAYRARHFTRAATMPDILDVACERFFPGATAGVDSLSIERGRRGRLLRLADRLCEGGFSLLGYDNLAFGTPVDWHLDPVSGRNSPRRHWSRIDPLDPQSVGDSKVIWELNRHQWLVRLAQAYRLSGNERYAQHFAEMIRDWMRENPPGVGINWASSLEVSIRLMAWSWAMVMFRDAVAFTSELRADMLVWIGMQATHIERYLSRVFSPNTHLTGEALGLYYAGTVFPDLDVRGTWQRKGRKILISELHKQVYGDGVYFEQSTCYQRYTAEIYLQFVTLARRNDDPLPDFVAKRVQLLIDWLVAVQHPDGTMPKIGDEDGGWLLPLEPRAMNDYRGVFALAAAVFQRTDYAWAAQAEHSEVAWLLGEEGLRVLRDLGPKPPAGRGSRYFPQGGYVVMRGGWRRNAHQLIFDVGPLGCHFSSGHGHADLLSIQCAAFGRPLLVDPGTGCYTPKPLWRDHFRSTAAHNTARIDGAGQAEPTGPFRWNARPVALLRSWNSTPDFDYADGALSAVADDGPRVSHRRRVVFMKRRAAWIVVDDFLGRGRHTLQANFQFAPRVGLSQMAGWLLGMGPGGVGLFMKACAPVTVMARVFSGARAPVAGWVSDAYGQWSPAPQVEFFGVSELPARMVTLLVPVRGDRPLPPYAAVEFLNCIDSRVHLRDEIIAIGEDGVSVEMFRKRDGLDALIEPGQGVMPCAG